MQQYFAGSERPFQMTSYIVNKQLFEIAANKETWKEYGQQFCI